MRTSFRAVVALATVPLIALLGGCAHDSHDAPRARPRATPAATSHATRVGAGRAASRVVFWTSCKDVVALTDAQLDEWRRRGAGGFVCEFQHLADLGGDQSFSAQTDAARSDTRYSLQRQIRDSKIVDRAKARGIKMWLGFYFSNYFDHSTPLDEWFDDGAWSTQLIPRISDVAGAARKLGFAGLAFDEEPYDGGTWDWNYKGNTHREAEVRAKVRTRGAQMMHAIVASFPAVDLIDYGTYFPDGWNALVQEQVNHTHDPYAAGVQIDLWDGLTSGRGYGPIRFLDATFYKTAHLEGASWDNAMIYNDNRLMAYFSRHLANWAYASTRINVSPFAWIDGDVQNEGSFTAPRPPAYVSDQLAAFRKWGMGGAFGVYAYGGLEGSFDYGPYVPGLQAAARPGAGDGRAPTLTVSTIKRLGGNAVVSGTATDDTAIRSVVWRSGARTGSAAMTWTVTGGSYRSGYRWQTDWTATIPAALAQLITFTAVDGATNAATLTQRASEH